MSRYYEFEGKNIDAAVRNACDILKIARENLEYAVVQPGSSGFLGFIGKKTAKIRVKRIQNGEPSDTGSVQEPKPTQSKTTATKKTALPDKDEAVITAGDNETAIPNKDDILGPFEMAQTALRHILDCVTSDAQISVDKKHNPIELMVNGPRPGIIIGKHGQTLEAIQYLVEKMVSRKYKKHIRLQIDVENYLKKRKHNLIQLALRLSEKAKATRKPVTIGVMNSQERRIVHIALRDKGVRTKSIGSGNMRKLTIFPRKNNRRAK
ncbi:RNA-binding cell elongation regulator Jag/EloR [Desulfococcaceae bacterium HSG7]|nr:RNA-binding cell elongation regulator Jag/EloR [Desulfococcaceae bacterium HSG7]